MKCGFLVITGVGHLAGEDNGVDWPAGSSSLKLVARPVAGEIGTEGSLSLKLGSLAPDPDGGGTAATWLTISGCSALCSSALPLTSLSSLLEVLGSLNPSSVSRTRY